MALPSKCPYVDGKTLSFKNGIVRFRPRRRKLFSNSNKEFLSPTIATAIYIDEANPMPRNWEKEE